MLRQRRTVIRSQRHLAFIRELPSLVRGAGPVDAAHVRYGELRYGKDITGMAQKPGDNWTVPLAHDVHMAQHARGERDWWEAQGIDPILVAALLWAHSGDHQAADRVISMARYWPIRSIVA
ncbi:hypothetical protein [Devosia sp. Root105]|uniref:hypothetical protein n=1 Tax=Devosia sp. Root105 TaxID=1736423 RepID=UPI0006F7C620|nr:hypothetical protein [Devosia sp. Root105]KQU96482.1 hypothetical protein ASC68_13975 [Devosia sp. Root105]